LVVAQATRTCPQCKTRCAATATACPACGASAASNGSNGNGRRRHQEVEYDDLEAPRGHVVRSKRASAILSGELQAEPPPADRMIPMEPSIALGAGQPVLPERSDGHVIDLPAKDAIGDATAEVLLIPRRSGGGMLGILLGAVVVVGVAIGAWYVARATDDPRPAAAAPTPSLPPAPVVTPVAPVPAPAVQPDEVADPVEVEVAADDPVVEPAPAATVTIRFSSSPDGAEVRIAGAKKRLGVTPFVVSLPRVEGAQAFEFSKRGFETVTGQVALDVDSALTVALSKKGRPGRRGGAKNSGAKDAASDPTIDRGGTMDVLGDDR
jgi:hypothetical protein